MYHQGLQPHNLEAERAVLGSILIDGDCLEEVAPLVKPGDFYRESHLLIYQAALRLKAQNLQADQVTIARELDRQNHLETSGGMAALSSLVATTPTSTHSVHYATIVRDCSRKRRLMTAASEIYAAGSDETISADESLERAEKVLSQVHDAEPAQGLTPISRIFDSYLEDAAAGAALRMELTPALTGMNAVDELLGELKPGNLIVIGARTSMGKTSLAITAGLHVARQGKTVAIFSLEMTSRELVLRMLAGYTGINLLRLEKGLYTEEEENRLIAGIGELSDLPILVDDTPKQSINRIRAESRRQSRQRSGLDMIIIDYLQLASAGPKGRYEPNRVQEMTEVSGELKNLAKELRVPVVSCAQVNRQPDNRAQRRPQLSDLRESGSIEQDADVVLFVHREDRIYTEQEWGTLHPDQPYPKNVAEIIIAKARNGPTGSVKLRFHPETMTFTDFPTGDQPSEITQGTLEEAWRQ